MYKVLENKIKKSLVKCGAPTVEINNIKGVKKIEGKEVQVDRLYVSMGECTGDEFESIKRMREQIEIESGVSIVNIMIYL